MVPKTLKYAVVSIQGHYWYKISRI